MNKNKTLFDTNCDESEQLPRKFDVNFESVKTDSRLQTKITVDGIQVGDIINDNSKENDGYRFHDVFHYTFAAILGWSPCSRAMMKRKRKSNQLIDEIEDGARAIITEESISLIIFNKAKRKEFFKKDGKLSQSLLNQIKEMTAPFEVAIRSRKDWQKAIFKGYSLFRELVKNNGGKVRFNMLEGTAIYEE